MIVRPIAALAVALILVAGCTTRPPRVPRPAVFEVAVAQAEGPDDVATGVALGPGCVLTVAHVLRGHAIGARAYLRPPGARSGGRAARVVAIDERDDLAILAVPGLRARRATIGSATGEALILKLRDGGVQALSARVLRSVTVRIRTPDGSRIVTRPALELRAEVLPGDSGAPVLSGDGRVAGIVFARTDFEPEIAFAVRASVLGAFIKRR